MMPVFLSLIRGMVFCMNIDIGSGVYPVLGICV